MLEDCVSISRSLREVVRDGRLFRVNSPVDIGKFILDTHVKFGHGIGQVTYSDMYVGDTTARKVHDLTTTPKEHRWIIRIAETGS